MFVLKSYRQMAGRAGRKGAGRARGEALLIASNKGQAARATGLMNAGLAAVRRWATCSVVNLSCVVVCFVPERFFLVGAHILSQWNLLPTY